MTDEEMKRVLTLLWVAHRQTTRKGIQRSIRHAAKKIMWEFSIPGETGPFPLTERGIQQAMGQHD